MSGNGGRKAATGHRTPNLNSTGGRAGAARCLLKGSLHSATRQRAPTLPRREACVPAGRETTGKKSLRCRAPSGRRLWIGARPAVPHKKRTCPEGGLAAETSLWGSGAISSSPSCTPPLFRVLLEACTFASWVSSRHKARPAHSVPALTSLSPMKSVPVRRESFKTRATVVRQEGRPRARLPVASGEGRPRCRIVRRDRNRVSPKTSSPTDLPCLLWRSGAVRRALLDSC